MNLPLFSAPKILEQFAPESNLILFPGDAIDFLASLPSESVNLIITSPPYNLGKAYETKVSIDAYLDEQRAVIEEINRVLHTEGSICWQVGNFVQEGEVFPLDIYYYPMFKDIGLRLRNRIVWYFRHGLHASKRFSGRYETLLWFTKGNNYTFNLDDVRVPAKYPGKRHFKGKNRGKPSGNPMGKNPSDIWEILIDEWETGCWDIPNVKANHPEKTLHPCQFPVELVERCVLALTNPGDWVLDPFAGVGSTLIAAIKNERRGMGSERDLEYVQVARQRLHAYANGTLKLRPLGKPVHQPSGREKVSQVPEEWSEEH
ncbi:MAG: site-specific DNA-methyltransferase [Anaerolineae bacterium]|nr:site-specific DNA-methyltransferase [Anaerolineae bacterium]